MGFHIARPISCIFYDLYLRLRNQSKNHLSIYPGLIQNITQGFISYNIHAISLFYLLCFSWYSVSIRAKINQDSLHLPLHVWILSMLVIVQCRLGSTTINKIDAITSRRSLLLHRCISLSRKCIAILIESRYNRTFRLIYIYALCTWYLTEAVTNICKYLKWKMNENKNELYFLKIYIVR